VVVSEEMFIKAKQEVGHFVFVAVVVDQSRPIVVFL